MKNDKIHAYPCWQQVAERTFCVGSRSRNLLTPPPPHTHTHTHAVLPVLAAGRGTCPRLPRCFRNFSHGARTWGVRETARPHSPTRRCLPTPANVSQYTRVSASASAIAIVCVCVCVCTYIHTHTHTYIHAYNMNAHTLVLYSAAVPRVVTKLLLKICTPYRH